MTTIISKRISECQILEFNEAISSLRITLTPELTDMKINPKKDKISISLVEEDKIKKIIIEKL